MLGHVGPIEALTEGNRTLRPVAEGMRRNLINTGKRRLRPFTIWSSPEHGDRLVEATKAMADKHEAERVSATSPGKDSQ